MSLKINEEFKKKFNERKDRELLQKLKDKYENDDDDDSDSEESYCPKYTKAMDDALNNVINAVRSKDPKLDDPEHNWYEGVNFEGEKKDGRQSSKASDDDDDDEEYQAFTKQVMLDVIKQYKRTDKPLNDHAKDADQLVDGSEDEKEFQKAEIFEYNYNFRYENQGKEFSTESSMKTGDAGSTLNKKGAIKKNEEKKRKEQEKAKKKAELKKLEELKEKETMKKMWRLKKISGIEMELRDADLDGDFDPQQHDEMMKKYFGKSYLGEYDVEDVTQVDDKIFHSDDEDEDWDNWGGEASAVGCAAEKEEHVDEHQKNKESATRKEKKTARKKKRSKFAEMLRNSTSKPIFNPEIETFDEYVAKYYDLDCEDVIDGQKCRFQYKKVYASGHGLSTEEVLNADDNELEEWMPLKSITECRADEEEMLIDRNVDKKLKKKKKVLKSLFKERDGKESIAVAVEMPDVASETLVIKEETSEVAGGIPQKPNNKKKRKKKNKNVAQKPGDDDGDASGVKVEAFAAESEASAIDATLRLKKLPSGDAGQSSQKTNKKKKKNNANKQKVSKNGGQVVCATVEISQKPNNNNNKKRKREDDDLQMTDDRLKAYGIEPKKFKYHYAPKVRNVNKNKK